MLSERLRSLMKERGYTQARLGKEAGVSRTYIWQLLNQPDKSPGVDVVGKLAAALGCTIDDLVNDNTGAISAWDEDHVVVCAKCTGTKGLNMFAHRSRKDKLVGFMFLCKGCADVFGGASVKLHFDKPFGLEEE